MLPRQKRLGAVVGWLIMILLAAVLAVQALCTVCAQFAAYDDVGYLLLTQKLFFAGQPLYDQTFAPYGPAYFAWAQFLHAILRLPLSHDSALISTSVVWVAISLLCAGYVARLARNLFLTALTFLAVFGCLELLKREPGHPQELCVLLLGGMLLLSSFMTSGRRLRVVLGGIGFLVGVLAMTKLNLGMFAALAGWVSLSNLVAGRKVRNILFGAGALAAVALPVALMRHNLAEAGGYCLLESGAILLLVIQLAAAQVERSLAWQSFAAPAAGFGTAVVACAAYALGTGTSVAGLLRGVVLRPIGFDQVFSIWPPFELEEVVLSLGLAFAVWVAAGPGRRFWQGPSWLPAALKSGVAPLIILSALTEDMRAGRTILWCLPLVVATAYLCPRQPRGRIRESLVEPVGTHSTASLINSLEDRLGRSGMRPYQLVPRHFAISLAVLNALWAYPVWGTQTALSVFLLMPVAVVSCADALRYGQWGASATATERPSPGRKVLWTVLSYAGAVGLVCLAILQCAGAVRAYQRLEPSGLRGSRLLHIPADQAAFYHRVIQAARAHGRSFFTMPGLGSLYFWAEADPPTRLFATSWMTLFTPDQQSQVVRDLEQTPDLCVIRWNLFVEFWAHGRDISGNQIVRYLEDNFVTVESFGGCDIMVRRPAAGQNGGG